MRFLYTMSFFMSLERIENGIDDLFMFKEPEKADSLAGIFHLLRTVRCSTGLNGSDPEQMNN